VWKTPRAIKLTDVGGKLAAEILGIERIKQPLKAVYKPTEQVLDVGAKEQTYVVPTNGVPLIGKIAASNPPGEVFTEESDTFDASRELEGDKTYVLVVEGDSMIGDHICNGDYVYIKQQPKYENGDIVAAFRSDQGLDNATLKRFFLEEELDRVRLQPSNPKYAPILVPQADWKRKWQIQGKFLGLVRLQPHT
jgi:SOS-response transcriptional repressor LexA